MAVTNGPQIALRSDIGAEAGLGSSSNVNLNNASIRGLIGKASGAQNAMSEYYGAEPDNSLSSYAPNGNVHITGAGSYDSWSYASDANSSNTNPTSTETMYWNRGDQPFDGTTNGSFASANTGRLFRRYGGCDNGTIYHQSNGRFGDIQGGSDNYYQPCSSGVWAFPWQKITKGPHTFYGNYYFQVASYPSAGTTYQALYLVEYDTWTLDPNDSTRGILSNLVARTALFSLNSTSNRTNWNGQTWSKARTTVGRYLCLEWHGSANPNHYTKYYMSCNVS